MEKEARIRITKEVNELIAAPSCCPELKAEAQKWLAAAGTDKEAEASKALVAELKEDISTIDHVIAFFGSDAGKSIFGADKAAALEKHAKEVKAAGGKYCDCPACTAGLKILGEQKYMF